MKLDSKMYLFAMQTFFNIFLKLLIHSFLSQLVNPTFTTQQELSKAEIDSLFDGTDDCGNNLVDNFLKHTLWSGLPIHVVDLKKKL